MSAKSQSAAFARGGGGQAAIEKPEPAGIAHWPFAAGAVAAAGAVFAWGLANERLLLYGDATAHLMIARRIVDSRTPGLSQWGSVWLPFPHLLMAPFTLVMSWWRTGAAGAIVAIASFALAAWFLHRLAARHFGRAAADWAGLAFVLNPNLLYLAAVPMTEAIYLMTFLGAVDQISLARTEAGPSGDRHAVAAGLWALAAVMTRYDGWFCLPFFALAIFWPRAGGSKTTARPQWGRAARFCALAGIGPVFWFAFNQFYFGDWLNFLRGPYSARAIYLRALRQGGLRYPGDHHLLVAAQYFGKAAALDCGLGLLIVAGIGLAAWWWRGAWAGRQRAPASAQGSGELPGPGFTAAGRWVPALLLLPLPWYLWAMWSGNVPIFVPMYWPHGYYNLRYGVQVLPAAAVLSGWAIAAAAGWRGWPRLGRARSRPAGPLTPAAPAGLRRGIWTLAGLGLAAGYLAMLGGTGPMTYAEAVHNAPARLEMEHQLARALRPWRQGQTVLMYVGSYPGALADDGIPLRDVIEESNFRQWDQALAAPERHAAWVVFQAGSPLARGIQRAALAQYYRAVARFTAARQPVITVYRRKAK